MKRYIALLGLALIVLAAGAEAAGPAKPADDNGRQGYTFGYQLGARLRSQLLDVDTKSFLRGMQDALSNAKPALTEQEMNQARQQFQKSALQKRQVQAEMNRMRGEAYLAQNKSKPGVKVLMSGVQYRVLKEGSGESPKLTDTVTLNYRGTLVDGTEFDSSYSRDKPVTFEVNGLIPGWQQVLPLMKKGAKWQVVVPPSAAYGERGTPGGPIGPNETLVFDIELLDIKK
jgi:FKBP-type peptidyl-prolyl cis-trans isomerase FklB